MPTQSTDINSPTGPALTYTTDDETWIIDTSITVASQDDDGVVSTFDGSTLINNGNVVGHNAAVGFSGANAAITNNAGHNMIGASVGISFKGGGNGTVTNHGLIAGFDEAGIFFDDTSGSFTLDNTGEIFGRDLGVAALSQTNGGTIDNSGLIRSDGVAIAVRSESGEATVINNAKPGTIDGGPGTPQGPGASIFSVEGRIALTNKGVIDGDIMLMAVTGNVDDTIVNTGKGKILGEVHLGDGADTYKGGGKAMAGAVFGEDGEDFLKGGKKKDVLVGGLDQDKMNGGKGPDKFVFNDVVESAVGANRDLITGFKHDQRDKIDLHNIGTSPGDPDDLKFKFIGTDKFHDKAGELRYQKKGKTLIVSGDVDGDGAADFQIGVKGMAEMVKGDFIL